MGCIDSVGCGVLDNRTQSHSKDQSRHRRKDHGSGPIAYSEVRREELTGTQLFDGGETASPANVVVLMPPDMLPGEPPIAIRRRRKYKVASRSSLMSIVVKPAVLETV